MLPFAPMTQTKLTAAEVKDLRARLTDERGHLESQLESIVEGSFAATQSDMAGDVGLDDESADAGTATFEREKDLSIENNVRDLLRKIDGALEADGREDLRPLRALREADREGADQGPPVRGALHQGRAGRTVAPLIAWTRRGAGRRRRSSSPRSWPTVSTASRRSGRRSRSRAIRSTSSPECSRSGSRPTRAARSASARARPGSSSV